MEMEEVEGEENGGKVRRVFNRGFTLGKKMLVAGFVVSSAPLVLPPLLVASAIGLAVSLPYAFFLASHACTQNLMSKLLPRPTPQYPLLLKEGCFQPDIDIIHIGKEEQGLGDETKRDTAMVSVQYMDNKKNMTMENDYGQGVVKKEDEPEVSPSEDATDIIQHNGFKEESSDYFSDDGMEGHLRGESNGEQPMSEGHGVVTIIESLDKIGNESEEFKTPFEVATVVSGEFRDQAIEGDVEESELQRETKGLLEKIRDEGRTDRRGEYVKGIRGGTNESDQKYGSGFEKRGVAWEDKPHCIVGVTEGDVRKEEAPKVCEEVLQSRNDENKDTICNEVESGELIRGLLEGKEVDHANDSEKPLAGTIPDEAVGDLLIEMQVYNNSAVEDSSEVTSEKTDIQIIVKEELKPLPHGPTVLHEGKLDNYPSDFVNQESQLHEHNEIMDSSDADAREVADENGLDLFDENTYTIDLQEESSNVMVDGHTDSMEVLVSSVEQESRPSECSSVENIMCPSHEAVFNEENIRKQIHVIRKIVGYEGTTQASCADELKALYIFIGVEPPSLLKNSCDPAEINEKLHFLMSVVGIKSNVA